MITFLLPDEGGDSGSQAPQSKAIKLDIKSGPSYCEPVDLGESPNDLSFTLKVPSVALPKGTQLRVGYELGKDCNFFASHSAKSQFIVADPEGHTPETTLIGHVVPKAARYLRVFVIVPGDVAPGIEAAIELSTK